MNTLSINPPPLGGGSGSGAAGALALNVCGFAGMLSTPSVETAIGSHDDECIARSGRFGHGSEHQLLRRADVIGDGRRLPQHRPARPDHRSPPLVMLLSLR